LSEADSHPIQSYPLSACASLRKTSRSRFGRELAHHSRMIDSHLRLALLSTAVLGFRHGLDYDHIAAITDISSVQLRARDAMRFGLLYVGGHATTVAVLGALAVTFRLSLPPA